MTYLNGAGIINDALSLIRNNSTPVRTKMLLWLNIVAQNLATIRPWQFLSNGSATLTPVNNVLTLPADYGEFQSLSAGTTFLLNPTHRLTEGEAWRLDNAAIGFSCPRGFTEGTIDVPDPEPAVTSTRYSTIILHGGAYTDPVTVSYTIEPPAITDTATPTVWPSKCRALFQRSLLDGFYEYDMDERAALAYQLNEQQLSILKAWDNSQKPRTQYSRHGYRRTR